MQRRKVHEQVLLARVQHQVPLLAAVHPDHGGRVVRSVVHADVIERTAANENARKCAILSGCCQGSVVGGDSVTAAGFDKRGSAVIGGQKQENNRKSKWSSLNVMASALINFRSDPESKQNTLPVPRSKQSHREKYKLY